jgi:hypothetical protein
LERIAWSLVHDDMMLVWRWDLTSLPSTVARVGYSLEAVDLTWMSVAVDERMYCCSYLYGLCVKFEAILRDQELLNIFALITLQLDHLAHLTVVDDCAIASELLLDHLQDLLLIELLRQALNCGQSLATIALYIE